MNRLTHSTRSLIVAASAGLGQATFTTPAMGNIALKARIASRFAALAMSSAGVNLSATTVIIGGALTQLTFLSASLTTTHKTCREKDEPAINMVVRPSPTASVVMNTPRKIPTGGQVGGATAAPASGYEHANTAPGKTRHDH